VSNVLDNSIRMFIYNVFRVTYVLSKTEHYGLSRFCFEMTRQATKTRCLPESVFCVVHLLSKGVPSGEDTFLSWHLAPVSEVTRGLTLPF
jgi:hypothetical protein